MNAAKKTNGSLALNDQAPRVITIEATQAPEDIKLRVAAYARVSSSSEDQLNSFAAQNRYYTSLISGKENWCMVDIYADEGITGTSAEKRPDFQRLLTDCRRGKIDRVLVKSISRFARNTTDCLEAIRELKSLGISIHFEKENIDTGKVSGEMLTTIFASMAQAESESISQNTYLGNQMKMKSGTFLPSSTAYGYVLRNRMIEIDEEKARIVRRIFHEYLSGRNTAEIAADLNAEGITKRDGRSDIRWHDTTIRYILSNERYIGDSLWQKTYGTDTFPTVKARNHGERQMYYVTDTHPAIIQRSDFERVQTLLRQRKPQNPVIAASSVFSKKLYCGACGTLLRKKSCGDRRFWSCRLHSKDLTKCAAKPVAEAALEGAFLRAYYKLKHGGIPILNQMISSLQGIRNRRMLWSVDIIDLNKKISDITSRNQVLTMLKQQGLIDPDIFIAQSNELTKQLRDAKLLKAKLLSSEDDKTMYMTQELIEILDDGPDFLEKFDRELFEELIQKVYVDSNVTVRFQLKNGLELKESLERIVR